MSSYDATIVGRNSAYWVHIAELLRLSRVTSNCSLMHVRLRVRLRRLTALTLDRTEISARTVLQANGSIHLILMRTLLLQSHFWDDNAISRGNSTWSFRLKGSYSSWVSSSGNGILSTTNNWFYFRARYPPPVSRMAWAHHHMLCIVLLRKLLLWKSVGDHVFSSRHPSVTRSCCGEFTPGRPLMLEMNLHLLIRRELIIDVLRWYHHSLDHLLLLMRGRWSVVGRIDWSRIWRRRLLPISAPWIKQVVEESDSWLIFNQIVVKLLLHELCEHLELVRTWLIHIPVSDFRYDLCFFTKQFFTLKALKKSLNVKIVETISDTPPRWCAERPPDFVDDDPLPLCQYSGAFRMIFLR